MPGLKSDLGGVGFSKVVPGLNPGYKSHPGVSEYEQVGYTPMAVMTTSSVQIHPANTALLQDILA